MTTLEREKKKKQQIEELSMRIYRLEIYLGKERENPSKGKRIYLSSLGLQEFPGLRGRKLELIRWNRNEHDLILVKIEGRKSLQQYHYSFFRIPCLIPNE